MVHSQGVLIFRLRLKSFEFVIFMDCNNFFSFVQKLFLFIDLVFFIRTHGTHKKEKEKGGRKIEKRTKDEKCIIKTQLKKISSTFINGTLIFIEEGNGGKREEGQQDYMGRRINIDERS